LKERSSSMAPFPRNLWEAEWKSLRELAEEGTRRVTLESATYKRLPAKGGGVGSPEDRLGKRKRNGFLRASTSAVAEEGVAGLMELMEQNPADPRKRERAR